PFGHIGLGVARHVARLVALEADAAGTEILAPAGRTEIAEAEAVIGESDRPVGIAFAGGNRIANAGDQHVAHHDLSGGAARRAAEWHDVNRHDGPFAVTRAQVDVLAAPRRHGLRRAVTVVERPGTARVGRHRAGEPRCDAVIDR